jgi:carboxyl-terminal processing protease
MHQRTWLSLLTFPLVAAFTYPVVFHQAREVPRAEARAGAEDPLAGLSDIQDVLTLVRDNYVDSPDLDKVIGGGIQAALERAHPLNSYLSPEDLHLPDPGPAGIGIRVVKRQIYAPVVAVVPGSPAAKAGFQVGDVVRKLDGNSIGPLSEWTLERRLRGPEGSELTLLRYAVANGELKKITLKREKIQRPPITVRKDPKATVLALADLGAGRAAEFKALLAGLDHHLPLVLDLRLCSGGTLTEAAQVAGCFGGPGPLVTVQETGKADLALAVIAANLPPFAKVAVLQGPGTVGPAEALSSALKAQGAATFGERSAGLGVERTRFLLKQGGAAEVVNKRWLGAGGEFLGGSGERPNATASKPAKPVVPADPNAPPATASAAPKPPSGYGMVPENPLKGLKPDEDPLPKILEVLEAKSKNAQLLPVPARTRRDPVLLSRLAEQLVPNPETV